MKSTAPTARQFAALRFVRDAIAAGRPPTQRALGAYLECNFKNAREVLLALERKGLVERQFHRARAIMLTHDGYVALDAQRQGVVAGGGWYRRVGRELPPEAPPAELGDLGPLEDEALPSEAEGLETCERLGIQVKPWAAEVRARIEDLEAAAMANAPFAARECVDRLNAVGLGGRLVDFLERHAVQGFNGDPSDLVRHALEVASGAAAIGHHGKIGGER